MNEPIRVGDLVIVVRNGSFRCQCLITGKSLGRIFRVANISDTPSRCHECGTRYPSAVSAWVEGEFCVYELLRLKRIPPLIELTHHQSEEKVKA